MTLPTTFSKIILVVLNLVFIAAGGVFIYIGVSVGGSQWSDILSSGTSTAVSTFGTLAIATGAGICAIACFGFFGALCRNKCLLTIYSIFVFLAMVLFIAAAVLAFGSASTANDWINKSFPAVQNENDVAEGFNQAYCYAQAGRLCTSASAKDALAVFLPNSAATITTVATQAGIDMTEATGVLGFCKNVQAKAGALASMLPAEYKKACDACQTVGDKYGNYKAIFSWADAKCPLNTKTSLFCGQFLMTNKQASVFTGAPYESCRPAVLDMWKSTSKNIAIGSTVLAVVALVVMFVACQAGKSPADEYSKA
ncbi:Aste57867_1624 [Aphanomyces stellatus]|uniref:Aste57867_1624 protein n=1 Tax=Aphanomyces stellatus TaxID=120398 RepID=A0A485K9V6_9STRA|nr:hypothetical protein As57867_001622 [Aphanomyces stellatus]VFT78837.1 Aste57867_1624 [Aphanomyces stellatus]